MLHKQVRISKAARLAFATMRYPPQLLDEIRARLPVSQVVGKRVALRRAGREFAGLSPFKSEKTPSFFVNDQKGFYHCFSSGEHGDIFKFLTSVEGISFPEAVERLAAEAGVTLPRASPEAQAQQRQRLGLQELVEAAAKFFEQQLASGAGREARAYLARRGISVDRIRMFRIGYAPDSRSALKEHLLGLGFTVADMITSGMLIGGDDIAVPYDRFRGRVMIPIEDIKGRVIAFGGRTLNPDGKPKYLNSPETPLFHKGGCLFNHHRARAAAHSAKSVVVVEGYMDAIALAGAGIGHVVAPLGTALTEVQLRLLWRMAEEPVLCFDGDEAGRRAANRAIDTALPHLGPHATLRIAFLPKGIDPDDLVRDSGPAAIQAVLRSSRPLADALWERETAGRDTSTPERRAQLEQRLRQLTRTIADPGVRTHYQMAMGERLSTLWRATRSVRGGREHGRSNVRTHGHLTGRAIGRPAARTPGALASRQSAPAAWLAPKASDSVHLSLALSAGAASAVREALLLRILINHPWLLDEVAEEASRLTFRHPATLAVRNGLLQQLAATDGANSEDRSVQQLDTATIITQLARLGLGDAFATLQRIATHRADSFAEPGADEDQVRAGWRHTVAVHRREIDLSEELAIAERAFRADGSEQAWDTIREIKLRIDALSADARTVSSSPE